MDYRNEASSLREIRKAKSHCDESPVAKESNIQKRTAQWELIVVLITRRGGFLFNPVKISGSIYIKSTSVTKQCNLVPAKAGE